MCSFKKISQFGLFSVFAFDISISLETFNWTKLKVDEKFMFRVNNLNDVICKRTNFLNCFYQKGKKFTTQQSKLDLSKFNSGLAFPQRLFAFALLLTGHQGLLTNDALGSSLDMFFK